MSKMKKLYPKIHQNSIRKFANVACIDLPILTRST